MPYYDVNDDGFVTGIDALKVINFLNGNPDAEGESGADSLPIAPTGTGPLAATGTAPFEGSDVASPAQTVRRQPLEASSQPSTLPKATAELTAGQRHDFALVPAADWNSDTVDSIWRKHDAKPCLSDLESILEEITESETL